MRVAVLSTGYPRFEGDVAGCFVEGFAETVRARGHAVHVFAPEAAGGRGHPSRAHESHEREPHESHAHETHEHETHEREPHESHAHESREHESREHESHARRETSSVVVKRVAYVRPRRWARTFYGAGVSENVSDPRAWPGLATYPLALRHAARGRWDAVIAHFGLPCGAVARTLDAPRILTVWHSADVALARRLPRSLLAPLLATGTHWFVRPDHLAALRPARGVVSPMGVHPPRSMPRADARRRLQLDERPVVLFVGRLVAIKGVDVLVRALAARRDLQLVIAGAGPESARLRAMAPSARFLGPVAGARKDACFAAADVVVLPSRFGRSGRSEGAPLVAREAAFARVPRVATTSVGLDDDEAFVVESESERALEAAIDLALERPEITRAKVELAAERAAPFAWEAMAGTIDARLHDAWR